MVTAVKTTKNGKTEMPQGYKNASRGNLPPLVILSVGEAVHGTITQVDERLSEVKKGGKKMQETRLYYRMELIEDYSSHDGKFNFDEGTIVSIPGSGQLDYTMANIAREIGKTDEESDPDWSHLEGVSMKIVRVEDSAIKKGPYKGKMAKSYDVGWKK